jgi:hypothetical protein
MSPRADLAAPMARWLAEREYQGLVEPSEKSKAAWLRWAESAERDRAYFLRRTGHVEHCPPRASASPMAARGPPRLPWRSFVLPCPARIPSSLERGNAHPLPSSKPRISWSKCTEISKLLNEIGESKHEH